MSFDFKIHPVYKEGMFLLSPTDSSRMESRRSLCLGHCPRGIRRHRPLLTACLVSKKALIQRLGARLRPQKLGGERAAVSTAAEISQNL